MLAITVLGVRGLALPNVHTIAQGVDQHYNELRSLEAEFTEIYQGGGTQRSESGTLKLKKPGKMRWDYRSPEEKLFVSNGKDAWLYLPKEKQVRKSSLKKMDDLRSPLAFLLGKSKLQKELTRLSFAPDVRPWRAGDTVLRGVPRGMEDRVEEVLVEVSHDSRIVRFDPRVAINVEVSLLILPRILCKGASVSRLQTYQQNSNESPFHGVAPFLLPGGRVACR